MAPGPPAGTVTPAQPQGLGRRWHLGDPAAPEDPHVPTASTQSTPRPRRAGGPGVPATVPAMASIPIPLPDHLGTRDPLPGDSFPALSSLSAAPAPSFNGEFRFFQPGEPRNQRGNGLGPWGGTGGRSSHAPRPEGPAAGDAPASLTGCPPRRCPKAGNAGGPGVRTLGCLAGRWSWGARSRRPSHPPQRISPPDSGQPPAHRVTPPAPRQLPPFSSPPPPL